MRYEKYTVDESASLLKFEFYSEGSKGKVKKQVIFVPFEKGPDVYNLAFGDVCSDGEIDDLTVTNNGDSQKVLATVASTVYRFFDKHPGCYIYATGSTKARIRLYRMGIANNLSEINIAFIVYGFIRNRWEVFEKGKDYEGFLLREK
jgi:hypothetical protein